MRIFPGDIPPKKNPSPPDPVLHITYRKEATFQSAVERWFKSAGGWLCYHTWKSVRSNPGFPDLVCSHADAEMTIFAELKTETGEVSDSQQTWLMTLAANPANEVYLWRPSDIEEITGHNSVQQRAITRMMHMLEMRGT